MMTWVRAHLKIPVPGFQAGPGLRHVLSGPSGPCSSTRTGLGCVESGSTLSTGQAARYLGFQCDVQVLHLQDQLMPVAFPSSMCKL